MGIEEKVIFVLFKDKVGAVNFCCCECRMVSGEGRRGAVSDLSAGYSQLLCSVGYLVNEVRSLKGCKVAACTDQGVTSDKKMGGLNRDINFSRDTIFNEVQDVTEREKHKCSILREFGCNSVNDVCNKLKEVCHVLNVGSVELSDVVKISDKRLFRAKVLND